MSNNLEMALAFWFLIFCLVVGAAIGAIPALGISWLIGMGWGFVVWLVIVAGIPLVGMFGILD